jgi:phosphonate transport system ATP-binding protein
LSAPMFELRGVGKQFGASVALRNINLRFERRERVALVGPSGAGKTTLLALLNGTLQPSSGEVLALGQPLHALAPRARRKVQQQIGTVYQQFHLVPGLRVIHNVNAGRLGGWSLGRAARSLVWPAEIAAARAALERVGIPEKLFERTSSLSGGQQQRVAIARVLVQDPQVILADEPIASLDPESGREVMDLLLAVAEQTAKTLITSIHAVHFAGTHFQRVIGVREGQILFDAPARDVTPEMIDALYRNVRTSAQGIPA